MKQDFYHISVLKDETIQAVFPSAEYMDDLKKKGRNTFYFIDCTLGGGGHSAAFIEKFALCGYFNNFKMHLFAFDRDQTAIEHSNQILNNYAQKYENFTYTLFNENFSQLNLSFTEIKDTKIDALMADFGVSSPHLDQGIRGFSLKNNGPVDMRMNPHDEINAKTILEEYSEAELTRIFFDYGEEPKSRRLAKAIIQDRKIGKLPLESTVELGEYMRRVLGYFNSRIHPATRAFQALRIEVNKELDSIKDLLKNIPPHMAAGGKIGIITFHSLEDRIVKHAMRNWQKGKNSSKDNSETIKERQNFHFAFNLDMTPPVSFGKEIPRGGITPNDEECKRNGRSRSARLRCFIFEDDFCYKRESDEEG